MSEEENDKCVFTRNPAVEQAAVDILGYREDQVKRLTIAQLERELGNDRKSPNGTKPKAIVSFSEPNTPSSPVARQAEAPTRKKSANPGRNDPRPKPSSPAKTSSDSKSSSTGTIHKSEDEHLAKLIKLCNRKIELMAVLSDDSDFDEDDLEDWAESIERARLACKQWEEHTRGRAERKARKIKQLHHDGLLDEVLQKKWIKGASK